MNVKLTPLQTLKWATIGDLISCSDCGGWPLPLVAVRYTLKNFSEVNEHLCLACVTKEIRRLGFSEEEREKYLRSLGIE
jgi:hypothetical protein